MSSSRIISLILVLAGGLLCYVGNRHRESLAGELARTSVKVANKVDGGSRVADSTWYLVGGAGLIVAGAYGLGRRRAA